MTPTVRSVLLALGTALAVCTGVALGLWQLGRADQKIALAQGIQLQGERAPIGYAELQAPPETLWHRHADVVGEWVSDATVFLDNRQMDGRPGFFVLTPLRLPGNAGILLIQRGWVPRHFVDRTRLPVVPTPGGPQRLSVRLAPPPPKLYEFGPGEAGPIRQNIDLLTYGQELKLALLPVSGLQLSDAQDGLSRHWPQPASDVHKHYGYAFQWFGLSTLFALLYVWFQFIAPRRRALARAA